jgi:hypothetical protein
MCFQLKMYERNDALKKAPPKKTNITKQNEISKYHIIVNMYLFINICKTFIFLQC